MEVIRSQYLLPHFWLGKLTGLGAVTLPKETIRLALHQEMNTSRVRKERGNFRYVNTTLHTWAVLLTWLLLECHRNSLSRPAFQQV